MLFGIVNGWISFHGGLVKLSVSGFPINTTTMLYIPRRASGLDTLNAFSENFTRRQQYVRVKILRRIRSSIDTSVQKKKGGGGGLKKSFFRPFGPHFGRKIRGGRLEPPRAPPLDTLSAQRIYQSMVMPIFTCYVSVIVLDGQSPANTWSASLRNEALENISPEMQSALQWSSIFNNW